MAFFSREEIIHETIPVSYCPTVRVESNNFFVQHFPARYSYELHLLNETGKV
jgi:hypothetical protein